MNFSRTHFIAIALGILVLGFVLFRLQSLPANAPGGETEKYYDTIVEETDEVNIKVKYPVLGYEAVDKIVEEWARGTIGEFRGRIAELGPLPEGMPPYPNELRIEYTTSQFSNRIKTIRFEVMEYTGGAHPNTVTVTKTYDLPTATLIRLEDIFLPGSDYLKKISEISYEDLKNRLQYPQEEMLRSGTAPLAENYQAFALDEAGITFIFDPYQVAPYAQGRSEVKISWASVKDLAREEFRPVF